jgi:RpiR family carbohydrate utilization transcriptional regulator
MNDAATNLLSRLRERMDGLPAAQRSVVQRMLDDPGAAVAATVEQLAQQAGVSMPTIVRTCRSFGFDSVREFMLALAQDLAVRGSYLHRSVRADDSASDVTSKIVHAAVS